MPGREWRLYAGQRRLAGDHTVVEGLEFELEELSYEGSLMLRDLDVPDSPSMISIWPVRCAGTAIEQGHALLRAVERELHCVLVIPGRSSQ